MNSLPAYKIFALGDAALTIDFGNIISQHINDQVISLFQKMQQSPPDGVKEVVPAYSSLTVYYDVFSLRKKVLAGYSVFEWMKNYITQWVQQVGEINGSEKRLISLPVCYEKEFAPDLKWVSSQLNIPEEEIIRLHTGKTYHVYMLGFLPGFSYMGEVDEKIVLPRKAQPVIVEAGAVGIAGKQTGVYPLKSPGGWQIIGRTPIKMFTKNEKDLTVVRAGDQVKFYSISKNEFENIKSGNS